MIDVHAHLCYPDFDSVRDAVLGECEKRMEAVVVSSARFGEGVCALELADKHEKLFPAIGYHPTEGDSPGKVMDLISQNPEKIVGVGEVGLDYHWEKDASKRKLQMVRFLGFRDLAGELGKPLVIHSWDAERECFDALKNFGGDVVFHCFSGSRELALEIADRNFFISLSTQIMFSKNHRKIAKAVPLESMTLETDSPFLSPYRHTNMPLPDDFPEGLDPKNNYPWNVALSAGKIASVRGIAAEDVVAATSGNARKVFGIKS